VLVTGIGGGGHGEQIIKALRLGTLDYDITGTDMSEACANRPHVNRFSRLPAARANGYLAALTDLARTNQCRAIFHGSEPEMMVLSHAKDALEGKGFYVPVNPPHVLYICQDKMRTVRHLAAKGYAVPESHEITAVEDLNAVRMLPTVLKPSVGGGGSANVFIAQTQSELKLFGRYLLQVYKRFIAQEYVGTSEQEYTVGVLFGSDGELINSIAIKRVINNALTIRTCMPNRTGRAELGKELVISTGISQGDIADWAEVRRQCEAIAASLEPRAPVNVQCRLVDGIVVPFEINPRFSGTTSLRALAGYNEPEILIRRDVFGEDIQRRFPYRKISVLRRLDEAIVNV